jgi:hypothetical protein
LICWVRVVEAVRPFTSASVTESEEYAAPFQ